MFYYYGAMCKVLCSTYSYCAIEVHCLESHDFLFNIRKFV